jgi:hypothetical protein
LGHAAIADLLSGDVLVEEKIDGSQFSFAKIDGELVCRSKGKEIIPDAPENMFTKAVSTARELLPLLRPGWVYRCEFLQKPKHNVLAYGRVPARHLIIFDINPGLERYLSPTEKVEEADRLELECVPTFYRGRVDSLDKLNELLETESCLGGVKVEGVVLKRYDAFTKDKKAMMGKYVSERFKERHAKEWKKMNPGMSDIIAVLQQELRTEARWEKAIQHMAERGQLDNSPRDIGPLMKEVGQDVLKEEADHIREKLFKCAWPKIQRGLTRGLPEWYKQKLAESAISAA